MPDFTIRGNPDQIHFSGTQLVTKADSFITVAESLSRITTGGWTGRAADKFKENFEPEPTRWRDAGTDFKEAGNALIQYSSKLRHAQSVADWARAEWDRGDQVTQDSQAAYGRWYERAQLDAAQAQVPFNPEPWVDPGQDIRDNAQQEFDQAKRDLDEAAEIAATAVRDGCTSAPPKRKWWEKAGRFIGGIVMGAGEAIWGLGEMLVNIWVGPMIQLLSGDLTFEEWQMKYQMRGETAWAIAQAAWEDPVAFGKEFGKAILDWDTWKDDPARAIGHLLPDAIAAFFTGGTSAAGTRGASAAGAVGRHTDDLLDGLDTAGDVGRRADDLGDAGRALDGFTEVPSGTRIPNFDDIFDNPRVSPDVRDLIDPDYSMTGRGPDGQPLSPDEFKRLYGEGWNSWKWPEDGTTVRYQGEDWTVRGGGLVRDASADPVTINPDGLTLDRIGGDGGGYFGDLDAPFSERSLPPDRLTGERTKWEVDASHPDFGNGRYQIHTEPIAPGFGQPGGGNQYRFFDTETGKYLTQAEADAAKLIRPHTGATSSVPPTSVPPLRDPMPGMPSSRDGGGYNFPYIYSGDRLEDWLKDQHYPKEPR